jgi:hypothetical protein
LHSLKTRHLLFIALTFLSWMQLSYARDTSTPPAKFQPNKTQYLTKYSQTLKKEVIELGRNIAYLAWVGGVRRNGSAPNAFSNANGLKALSKDMLELGRSLAILEDGLLAPPGIQLVVFVSLDTSDTFMLRHVELTIDNRVVADRAYSASEVKALHRGGVHRLYIGNLPQGKHSLTMRYTGDFGRQNVHKGEKTIEFTKEEEKRKTIELKLTSFIGKPNIVSKEWD